MLADVVELYRAIGKPPINAGGSFEFDGRLTVAARQIIGRQLNYDEGWYEVEIERDDGTARVSGQFPRQSQARAYTTLSAFFEETPTLAFAKLPDRFYIASEDYFSADAVKPPSMLKLDKLLTFIRLLTALADVEMPTGTSVNRLLFFLSKDGGKVQRTALLEIRPEESAIEHESPSTDVLEQLVETENKDKLHVLERKLLMRTAISEVLETAPSDQNELTFVIRNWGEVIQKFSGNLHAYINNFAFEEVRKKIVDAELEYASKLSGAFADVATKLLALPVSLLAIVALDDAKSDSAFVFGCAGLVITSIVLLIILTNVWLQVKRLRGGFDFIFTPIFDKSSTYPEKLKCELEKRKRALRRQMSLTRATFILFFFLAPAPLIGAAWKFHMKFPDFFESLLKWLPHCRICTNAILQLHS